MMKSYKIIILSENFIFSNVIAAFLENKSFGFESVKAVGFTAFFSEKIAKDYKTLLIIHSESLQLPEQIEMLKNYSLNIFSNIILTDSCISHAMEKFQFIPSKKLLTLSLNENDFTISKNIKTLVKQFKNNEHLEMKELSNQLGILRALTFKNKFNKKQMELIHLLPFNYKNEKMAEELHISLTQYNRLQGETADVAGVPHSKQALYKYVIDKGILLPDQDDEEIF